jgi:glycosyltransferase involved in cell wall biosynthesis
MHNVSVVVPTYNRADLIQQTLEAILCQSISAEIVIVDDGSTDNTKTILAEYGDRVRLISIENSGDMVARNIGLKNSSGELVAFCDSDDVWEPDFLSTMTGQWVSNPGLISCYSNFRLLKDGRVSRSSKFDDAPSGYWEGMRRTGNCSGIFDFSIVRRLLSFQPLFPSCMMVSRKAFLQLGGWDEGVSRILGCDFATALRVADHPPLGIVETPLVQIRKHSSNISGDTERMNLGDARVLEYVLRTRPSLRHLETEIRDSIAERRAAAIDSAFSRGDYHAFNMLYSELPRRFRFGKRWIKHLIAASRR